jgi:hypothetical protein
LALTCPGRERRRATSWSLQRAEAAFGRVLQPSFKPAGNDQRDNDSGGSGNSQDEANCAQRIRKRFPERESAQAVRVSPDDSAQCVEEPKTATSSCS